MLLFRILLAAIYIKSSQASGSTIKRSGTALEDTESYIPNRVKNRNTQIFVEDDLLAQLDQLYSFLDTVPLPSFLFNMFRSCAPSSFPSVAPTLSIEPTPYPTPFPTWSNAPTQPPTISKVPSVNPSAHPTVLASDNPSKLPSVVPTISVIPSLLPSVFPSQRPSDLPSTNPSDHPSITPSENPSLSLMPSHAPSLSFEPSITMVPSRKPSQTPSAEPSVLPTESFIPSLSNAPTYTVVWKQVGDNINGLDNKERAGRAVAMSYDGHRLIAGGSGIIRMFESIGDAWSQILDLSSFVEGDVYGIALSSDGKKCIVGDYSNGDNGALSGKVIVFNEDNNSTWNQVGDMLKGEKSKQFFGRSVGITDEGDKIAVGSGNEGDYVKIYQWKDANWSNQKKLTGDEGSLFGSSIALTPDGTSLIVGAPFADDNGSNSGSAFVYSIISFTLKATILGEKGEEKVGKGVALSGNGNYVAVGSDANYIKVFRWDTTTNEYARIGDSIYGSDENWVGSSISLSGDGIRIAVGSPNNNEAGTNAGKVVVYAVNEKLNIIGEFYGDNEGDYFGSSVVLSGDRLRITIGAHGNDGKVDVGQLRVYQAYGYKTLPPTSSHAPSHSVSPSSNPSISNMPTVSALPSLSAVPSLIPSLSAAPSLSANPSQAPSTSSMPSKNPSLSLVPSLTPTFGPSLSPKPSQNPSLSAIPSSTPSLAPSLSGIPSQGPSLSTKPSQNPSLSAVPSSTPSQGP